MRLRKAKSKNSPGRGNSRAALSVQQTIPYLAMHPDGVCQLPGGLYTKTVEYEDINYSVASTEIRRPFSAAGARSSITLTALCRSSFPLSTAVPIPGAATR